MMFFTQTLFALALATFCSAQTQSFGALPDCAKPCAANLPANCKLDVKCICADADFIKSISCCVADACSAQDLQKTLQVAQQLCSTVKVTLQAPAPDACKSGGGSSGAASGGSSAASGASEATSSAAAQVSNAASSAVSSQVASASSQAASAAGGASSAVSSASTAGSNTQASSTATSSTQASTGGAVQYASNKIGGLGAAVAAVLLL